MKKRRVVLVSLALAIIFTLSSAVPLMAATEEGVTVTATPAFVAMTNDPDAWTLNDIVGAGAPKGTIYIDTFYYSNPTGDTTIPSDPVVDGECRFEITNTSSVTTDVFVVMAHFSGGSDPMNNSDTGANGVGEYGAYSYCTGMTYSTGKVICKTTGSLATKEDLAPTTNIKWGLAVETQTDAWTGGTASTSAATVSLATA